MVATYLALLRIDGPVVGAKNELPANIVAFLTIIPRGRMRHVDSAKAFNADQTDPRHGF